MHEYDQAERPYNPEGATMQAERQTHVSASLSEIDEGAQSLLEAIRELERRLGDVLRPDIEGSDKVSGVPRDALVPLAERLTHHSGTVRMARQYVVSILDRLEL